MENKPEENLACACTSANGLCAYHALSMPACTECSRLASRVEELEKMLSRCYVWLPLEASALADDVKELLGLETYRDGAGAHAEEK